MPNPFHGNDEAAWYVDYYASPRMTLETVHRLYTYGVQHHQLAQRQAEEKAYPPVPAVLRTRAEMERYLHDRVQGELLRRQQHRAALRRQYSAAVDNHDNSPRRCLSEKELQRHLRKLYVEPMRRRAQRERLASAAATSAATTTAAAAAAAGGGAALARHAHGGGGGSGSDGGDEERHKQLDQQRRMLHDREAGWRPPSAYIPHKDDGARLLVSQETLLAPRPATATGAVTTTGARAASTAAAPTPPRPASRSHSTRDAHTARRHRSSSSRRRRLAELAKPLHVTPRVVAATRDDKAPRSFRVSLR